MKIMEQSFHCSSCNISYSDLKCFLEHCQTLEHAIKIQEKANENKVKNLNEQTHVGNHYGTSHLNDQLIVDDRKSPLLQNVSSQKYNISGNVLYSSCDICQKQFSGPEPYQQHIVSASHLKKVVMRNLTASSSSSNTLTCKTCDKNSSGPVPYEQHLNSEIHRKKVQSENLLGILKGTSVTDYDSASKTVLDSGLPNNIIITEADTTTNAVNKHTDTDMYIPKEYAAKTTVPTNWFCDVCQKGCTGPIPYQQHMSSEVHRKNLRKIEVSQKILTQIKENPSLDLESGKINNYMGISATPQIVNNKEMLPADGGVFRNWYCSTCQKSCSGPIPFQQHMSSDVHRKNLMKAETIARLCTQQMSENLDLPSGKINNYVGISANPQIVNNKEMLPADGGVSQNWYCSTCQKSCSGPIPFQQHMSSDVHRKNLMKAETIARLCAQQTSENKQSETRVINLPSQSENISLKKPNSLPQETLPGTLKSLENKAENSTYISNIESDYLINEYTLQNVLSLEKMNITLFASDTKLDFDNLPKDNYKDIPSYNKMFNYALEIKEKISNVDLKVDKTEEEHFILNSEMNDER